MVSIRKRWYNLHCPECRSRDGLKKLPRDRFHCKNCGKIVGPNKGAYQKYNIDYTDNSKDRHVVVCPRSWNKKQVRERAAELERDPGGNPHILFETVAAEWLDSCRSRKEDIRAQSLADYERKIRHALPRFGKQRIRDIRRPHVLELLVEKLNAGLSQRMVSEIRGRLYAVFAFAIEMEYITVNPASKHGRGLVITKASSTDKVLKKTFTDRQRRLFLDTADAEDDQEDDFLPLIMLLDRTGLRIGEAAALYVEDVHLEKPKPKIHVHRTRIGDASKIQDFPKSKAGNRMVDVSDELFDVLKETLVRNRKRKFGAGNADMPEFFLNKQARPLLPKAVRKKFREIIKIAELPKHLSPHSFRHTYARRQLELGTRLEYIQRQMGHEDIGITNKLYGRWAEMSDHEAANRLDNGYAKRQGKLELS